MAHPIRGRQIRFPVYYGWRLVFALGVTAIISYGTTQYFFGVVVVPLQQEFHWSRQAVSGAYALGVVVSGLLGIPVGRLVDRHGARALMTTGSAVSGLALIAMSRLQNIVELYALWSLGLGMGMALTYYPVAFTVVNNWFLRRRGTALGLLTFLGGLASIIFIPLSGLLVEDLGWRGAMLALGGVQMLVACPLHGLILRRWPEDIGLSRDGDGSAGSSTDRAAADDLPVRPSLHAPAFWTLSVVATLVVFGANVLFVHLVPYLLSRGVPPVQAAGLAGLLGLSSSPSRVLLNLLTDRWGPHYLLVAALALTAVGPVLLLVGNGSALFGAAVVSFGAGYGAQAPLRAAEVADHFDHRIYGTITALQGLPAALLGASGPVAAGWLFDVLGDYHVVLAMTAGGFVASAAAVLLTPSTTRKADTAAR